MCDTHENDEITMPPRNWWLTRLVLVIAAIAVMTATNWGVTTPGKLVSDLCGGVGSFFLLMGAWRSISVREELCRLSLIASDDELIQAQTADFFRQKNAEMLDMLRAEWRWYIDGVSLLVASFGITAGAGLRMLFAG
ncbi:hypothetical protein GR183_01690 [Stappia sp. GBMRC 2046]|uniref:Uncharacterized protein n=1 Tax=Stappia sediminis TaxID=2692190 RepID=A0A7X3S610_9HYPH|nr:hypothetical protein [Stappia sediminis]MXN63602.1 hypothetical protein [Stappia sediminis]